MLVLPAAIGSYLVVNLVCACIALGVGFGPAFGSWRKVGQAGGHDRGEKEKSSQSESGCGQAAAERASMATSRVADLTQGVASDVGEHAAKMKEISADLAGIDRDASGTNAAVLTAMDKILVANSELQKRLEAAETQLAVQAAEIKCTSPKCGTDSLTSLANRRAFDVELRRRSSEFDARARPSL